ncbi:hypothetical protein MKK58_01190 [Methylobacterium sp. J-078]|uniref:hypothetical protein n=1 Tax=Methylobacterium sp. J-078 TaxID=2836657 RepID=UPI001FB8BCDD|nr:hypothetical protein [Methylobacterium sp. J-078]MCJ2043170.1 hypothetical protein [Methylobacterium sp. J-078]
MTQSYNSFPDASRFAHRAESLALGFAGVAARAWADTNAAFQADAAQAAVYQAASARLQAARLKLARAEADRDAVRREAALRERDAQRRDLLNRARLLARLAA